MAKRNKYGVRKKKCPCKHDSKAEHARFQQLKKWEKDGIIKDLQEKQTWNISPRCETEPECYPIKLIPDFQYIDVEGKWGKKNALIVDDTKGKVTDTWKLKLKLFLCRYPDITFIINKAKYKNGTISDFKEELQTRRCLKEKTKKPKSNTKKSKIQEKDSLSQLER